MSADRAIVLVIGCRGQVGRELMAAPLPAGVSRIGLGHGDLDLTDRDAVRDLVERCRPALIVNAARYTAVDRAEAEPEAAFAVNAEGPAHLAAAAAAAGSALLHLSTDYVFDGARAGAYTEDDPIGPLGVYGASKAAGEEAVRKHLERHVILRTSWVFGAHGTNFVRTMLRLGQERDRLQVVADQRGCPTAAADIAEAVFGIARRLLLERRGEGWGTCHFAGRGATTWHGFAEAIFERAQAFWGRRPEVVPITTADYPTPARRPACSVLDCTRFERTFGLPRRPWTDGLDAVLRSLLGAEPPSRLAASALAPERDLLERRREPATKPTPQPEPRHRERPARA
jgi:dTDP-4-dehydrorhamnose reductase